MSTAVPLLLRDAAAFAALLLATLVGGVAVAASAAASCAMPAQSSPQAFTGTVLEVSNGGRQAVVRRDGGGQVSVRGGPTDGSVTSVDRTYVVGARYEFHPLNATDPYEDNACTATRLLSGPAAVAGSGPESDAGPAARGDRPGGMPLDVTAGWTAALAGLAALVAAGTVAGLVLARSRAGR